MTVRMGLPSAVGPAGSRPASVRPDQFSSRSAACLKAALDGQPAIRPDVVERARALAADPAYPSAAVLQHVARQILDAPDLSQIAN
jgi:hypothetical protein